MCSSTLSELRTGCEKHGRKNPLPYPFSKRSHVGNLRQAIQGKVGVKEEGKPQVSLPFCPPPWVRRRPRGGRRVAPQPSADGESPAEVQRKTLRPSGANPPAAVRVPRSADAAKWSRPSGANPPAAVRVPRSADAEKEPPVRGEPACGSSCAPVSRCRKGAARQGEPACGSSCALVTLCRERKAPQNCFHGAQSMHFYSNRSSVSTSLRAGACGSCAG